MPKNSFKECKKCGGKMIPRKSSLRRAHPGRRTCWEWIIVCNNCGHKSTGDWHGADRETVEEFLRTGQF